MRSGKGLVWSSKVNLPIFLELTPVVVSFQGRIKAAFNAQWNILEVLAQKGVVKCTFVTYLKCDSSIIGA